MRFPKTFDKFSWDSSRGEELLYKLEEKRFWFEEISNLICTDIRQIDEQIGRFTELMYDTFLRFWSDGQGRQTKPSC